MDEDYLAADIVINWAAEGLVLCFIHASVDLSPDDNDERHRTNWTNWCETPMMSRQEIELLSSRLLVCIPQTGNMSRVFQILANQPGTQVLLSWPPCASEEIEHEFAKLVETVNMDMGAPGSSDAKTSCTRRYKALQDTPIFGGEVESIFIPHGKRSSSLPHALLIVSRVSTGCIIFACHKVNHSSHNSTNPNSAMQLTFAPGGYNTQPTSNFYDQSYPLPSLPNQEHYAKPYMSQPGQAPPPYAPTQRWSQSTFTRLHPSCPGLIFPFVIAMSSLSNIRSNSYLPPLQETSWQQPPQTTYLDTSSPETFQRPHSPSYAYSPTTTSSTNASPTSDVVPPPRRRISPGTTKDFTGPTRTSSNRPNGISKCSSCKATSSPEWRKGPSGKKELCNA